ncbi:MAG: RluA family pseudouridine synthase [Candidatus Shikimatogenerans sp. Tser]|uniref:Pseudouridine synthase n=1 Tax=Candidatus Shikimatogenerans sp. Tser TaxID=3158568 RepID=A0AAU7QTC7_9FLAO
MKHCELCYSILKKNRIDKFLSKIYKISRNNIVYLIKKYKILVNNQFIKKKYILKIYDKIIILKNNLFYYKYKLLPKKDKLDILYEDDYLLIINKKFNLCVTPTIIEYHNTLLNNLLYKFNKNNNIKLINRLDKDTSGIILISKNSKILKNIYSQYKENKIIKKYIILVNGIFKKKRLIIKNNICRSKKYKKKMTISNKRGKYSISIFKKIKTFKNNTLLKCYLKTGRTHQIRVHLNSINYPIFNDKIYNNNSIKIK